MVARNADRNRLLFVWALLVRVGLLAAILLWIGFGGGRANAEVATGVEIQAFNSFLYADDEPRAAGYATAELDLSATAVQNIRSRFVLRTTLIESEGEADATVEVPRAEIRWRYYVSDTYDLRTTVGRTRLSWGDGVVYNAGDVINGARPAELDLTADELRDETLWLAALFFPLGRFAFFEPVALLPVVDPTLETDDEGAPEAWRTGAGGRVQFQLLGIKTESGYLYRGEDEVHAPYLSLQGNLFLDWYGGVSWEIQADRLDEFLGSFGLLYTGNNARMGGWTARTETLWSENEESLRLFPELTWAPSQLFTLFVRSDLELIENRTLLDAEAIKSLTSSGFTWSPETGLSISLYGTWSSEQIAIATVALGYVF